MARFWKWGALVLCLAAVVCAAGLAQDVGETAAPVAAEEEMIEIEVPVGVQPEAAELLYDMCSALSEAQSLSFAASDTTDVVSETGQIVQYVHTRQVKCRRPDALFAIGTGDFGELRTWYKGTDLTVLEADDNVYAAADVPDNLNDLLDFLIGDKGMTIPLADILYEDPYEVLIEELEEGEYVGQSTIDGQDCDHLVFRQETVDWQIWIDAGETAVPRRVVITYKLEDGQPQFVATLSDWDLTTELSDEVFVPKLPADAELVEMVDIFGEMGGDEDEAE